MKLLQIAKRGSGRQVVMQFTMSEIISIIAMFQTIDPGHDGFRKEKVMKAHLMRVLETIEETIKDKKDFNQEATAQGKVCYEYKEGEMDEIQRYVQEGIGSSVQ